jgi:hypothetical protein
MSDPSVISPILTSLVGLVGALVAGLSVYFNYKGRHNQFRQVVYGRQMDAYFDITESMAALYTAAQDHLAFNDRRLRGEDARERFRNALRPAHEAFTATVNRSLIVLPSKVKAAVDYFNETLLSVGALDGDQQNAVSTDTGPELAQSYERAVNCIRHHLAIDSLTTGMLKEMGIGSESVTLKKFRYGINPLVPVGLSHH